MRFIQARSITSAVAVVLMCLVAILASRAQQAGPFPTLSPTGQSSAGSPAGMDAERAQIWNSPNMLRARAWMQEYCRASKKFTPEDEKKYLAELENLTASQMKLWLLKFDHEEEMRKQQYAVWEQAHTAALARAMAADRATQQSYAAISREESQAAGEAQGQINEQQRTAQNLTADKLQDMNGPYGPYGGYGAYAGYGGVHYHFHLYPY